MPAEQVQPPSHFFYILSTFLIILIKFKIVLILHKWTIKCTKHVHPMPGLMWELWTTILKCHLIPRTSERKFFCQAARLRSPRVSTRVLKRGAFNPPATPVRTPTSRLTSKLICLQIKAISGPRGSAELTRSLSQPLLRSWRAATTVSWSKWSTKTSFWQETKSGPVTR